MKYFYGLFDFEELKNKARRVIECLGGGGDAFNLILETSIAESLGGTYKTAPRYNYGLGLCQFDRIAFDDIKNRTSSKRREAILEYFNIDIKLVEYRELAYSPLLSLIWCRLFYLLKPGAIPTTLEGRGAYWKAHYNTKLGKGTVEGYVKKVEDFRRKVGE